MKFPTWEELRGQYCSVMDSNPNYEEFSSRRYNPSPLDDRNQCRLVFLKDVLRRGNNKTLRRNGRFIWCKKLNYEGTDEKGFRQVSFSIDKGQKRFTVSENNILCIPAKAYVHNNRYFRSNLKTFIPFSTVFGYSRTINMMARNVSCDREEFKAMIERDSPFRVGTLVAPRVGYFYPDATLLEKNAENLKGQHPCGIILGRITTDDYMGRELYRVRFGDTTYERVHPVQMEILNEV